MKSDQASSDFPVLFVVRMVKGVRSWTVPLIASDGYAHYIDIDISLFQADIVFHENFTNLLLRLVLNGLFHMDKIFIIF